MVGWTLAMAIIDQPTYAEVNTIGLLLLDPTTMVTPVMSSLCQH